MLIHKHFLIYPCAYLCVFWGCSSFSHVCLHVSSMNTSSKNMTSILLKNFVGLDFPDVEILSNAPLSVISIVNHIFTTFPLISIVYCQVKRHRNYHLSKISLSLLCSPMSIRTLCHCFHF